MFWENRRKKIERGEKGKKKNDVLGKQKEENRLRCQKHAKAERMGKYQAKWKISSSKSLT